MTKYLRADPFTANPGDVKKYSEGWKKTFGKKPATAKPKKVQKKDVKKGS